MNRLVMACRTASSAALITAAAATAHADLSAAAFPAIAMRQDPQDRWQVDYTLARPAARLQLAINPDDSRRKVWRPQPGFQITHEQNSDFIERIDGRHFTHVRVTMPAAYRLLPKAYPPFSPFSDKGTMVHTGQFFACAEACSPSAGQAVAKGQGHPQWHVTLRLQPPLHAIVDGKVRKGLSRWTDDGEGKEIYVGTAKPIETPAFVGLIDPAVPPAIKEMLGQSMPKFMGFFAEHYGMPPQRPMLYASFQKTLGHGFGSQGGSLPGEVFLHLEGDPEAPGLEGLPFALTWHFAHEASHIFQQGAVPSDSESWVHEGAAEASAALALLATADSFRPSVEARIAKSRKACAAGLKKQPLAQASSAGDFQLYYDCGLVLQMRFDAAARAADPKSDGLFAIWRDYRHRVEQGASANGDTYLAAVAEKAGPKVSDWARQVIKQRLADPETVLAR